MILPTWFWSEPRILIKSIQQNTKLSFSRNFVWKFISRQKLSLQKISSNLETALITDSSFVKHDYVWVWSWFENGSTKIMPFPPPNIIINIIKKYYIEILLRNKKFSVSHKILEHMCLSVVAFWRMICMFGCQKCQVYMVTNICWLLV